MKYTGDTLFTNPVYDDMPAGTTTITVTPDLINGTYTVSNSLGSQTFKPIEPGPGQHVMNFEAIQKEFSYSTLKMLNNLIANKGTSTPALQLRYLSFADWQVHENNSHRYNYAIIGTPTATNDMPKAGSGRYTLNVFAQGSVTLLQQLIGNGTLDAYFDTGRIATRLEIYADGGGGIGKFEGAGTMRSDSSLFQGTLNSYGNSNIALSGTFDGAFFGPGAAEVGYTFDIRGTTVTRPGAELRYLGVAIGKKD